jgi:hypothetical protein
MNWSPNGQPGSGDTVAIHGPAQPIGVDSAAASGLAGLSLSNAALTGGTISVTSGAFTWTSGTISLVLTLGPGVTSTMSGTVELAGGEIDNAGTFNWTGGMLQGDGGAVLRNTGTFVIALGTTSFVYGSGLNTCDFYNAGTLNLTGSGKTTNPVGMWGFHNAGTIHFTSTGTLEWQTSSNTQHTLDDGGTITGGGTLLFDESADPTLTSVLTVNGTTSIGTGATLQFGTGVDVTVGASGGTLKGPGTLVWTGGHIDGTAQEAMQPALTWDASLPVHLTGPDVKDTAASHIVSNAKITWDQGDLGIGSFSYFTNAGTLTAAGDLDIVAGPSSTEGYSKLENRGSIVKSTGSGKLTVDPLSILNYGTVHAASGSIALVSIGDGPNVLEDGSTLQGSIAAYCEVDLAGSSTVAAGSALELGNDGTHASTLAGSGSLGGAGTVTIDGAAIQAGAMDTITFASGGQVVLANNAALTTFSVDGQGALDFAGTTAWTGGALEIETGTVTNSGAWTTKTAGSFTVNSSGSAFSNTGSWTSDPGGAGTVDLEVVVTNAGTVTATSGTLLFGRDYTQTAGKTVLAGGSVAAHDTSMPPNPHTIDIQGGSLEGAGMVDAVVTNEGTVAPGSAKKAGTLTITQTYTQSATGTLAVALGGTAPGTFDVLATNGDVTLDGDLAVTLLPGYVPSTGDSYKVLVSAGADPDQGMFAKVDEPAGVTLTTTYDPNDVVLGVTGVMLPDGGMGGGGAGGSGGSGASGTGAGGGGAGTGTGGSAGGGGKSCSCEAAGADGAWGGAGGLALACALAAAVERRRRRAAGSPR